MDFSAIAKSLALVTAAALTAGLAVFLTSAVPEAKAESQVTGSVQRALLKATASLWQ